MSETELTHQGLGSRSEAVNITSWALTMHRAARWLQSPRPYLMLVGFALFLGFWYLAVEVWRLPRFAEMPGPTTVVHEWLSQDPTYGLSVFVDEYYLHIWVSTRRILIAFALATGIGVPLGLFLGWSKRFKQFVFPVFELLRPIPPLAWVPLAIVMFKGSETPVIFLTFLASFYATALNTMLGVESIDVSPGARRVSTRSMPALMAQFSASAAWGETISVTTSGGRMATGAAPVV
jgi:ABC-type nitrate/sulfonate/bicarbonate transport system permease component